MSRTPSPINAAAAPPAPTPTATSAPSAAPSNGRSAPDGDRAFTRRLAGDAKGTHHPDALYPVPAEELFDNDSKYMAAPDLERIAALLLKDDLGVGHFAHLKGVRVVYLWKRAGRARNGRFVYGKCSKPSGLLQHFAEADFVIWLAADHLRDMQMKVRDTVVASVELTRTIIGATHWQVEALLSHELEHIGTEETDDGVDKLVLKPHDLEIFRAEIERYGPWQADIIEAARSFKQMPLWEHGVQDAPPAQYAQDA